MNNKTMARGSDDDNPVMQTPAKLRSKKTAKEAAEIFATDLTFLERRELLLEENRLNNHEWFKAYSSMPALIPEEDIASIKRSRELEDSEAIAKITKQAEQYSLLEERAPVRQKKYSRYRLRACDCLPLSYTAKVIERNGGDEPLQVLCIDAINLQETLEMSMLGTPGPFQSKESREPKIVFSVSYRVYDPKTDLWYIAERWPKNDREEVNRKSKIDPLRLYLEADDLEEFDSIEKAEELLERIKKDLKNTPFASR